MKQAANTWLRLDFRRAYQKFDDFKDERGPLASAALYCAMPMMMFDYRHVMMATLLNMPRAFLENDDIRYFVIVYEPDAMLTLLSR